MPWRLPAGLLLLLAAAPALAVAVAGRLHLVADGEETTVRLALSAPLDAAPRVLALDNPKRLVIDLGNASAMRGTVAGSGRIDSVRIAQFDPSTVRLVIDLGQPMLLVAARQDSGRTLELRLQPADEAGFRSLLARGRTVVAGFRQQESGAPPGSMAGTGQSSPARMAAVEAALAAAGQADGRTAASGPLDLRADAAPGTVAAPPTGQSGWRPRTRAHVIVLDAGHGGTDPGAPSGGNGSEKAVTLAIVRAARTAIESLAREKGVPVTVRLTRDDDHFVPLGSRVRMARDWNADLFVSIHADSAPNPDARGASVYTLSEVASDREAARVAAKENRADLIAGVDLSSENREVANILVDLGRRSSMNASADFAETLKDGLEPEGVGFRSQFHRYANFQVLRNLGVPAVLIETGYLSNRDDASFLFSKKGQQAIANGIAAATIGYLAGR